MPPWAVQILPMLLGRVSGSNNKASIAVHGLRFVYISTGGVIAIAWYSGWRNERIAPGSFKFPFPGVDKLAKQFPTNREEHGVPGAPEGPHHEEFGTSVNNPKGKPGMTVGGNGTAKESPPAILQAFKWCQKVSGQYPYKWGGGHPRVGYPSIGEAGGPPGTAGPPPGFDCSGSVCGALWAAKLIRRSMASGELMSYGEKGPGKYWTIWANAEHTFMRIKINGVWQWFGTGSNKQALRGGPAWGNYDPDLGAYVERHPVGL